MKLAGGLSREVSLPTRLAGLARYSRDSTFAVQSASRRRAFGSTEFTDSRGGSDV